MGDGAVGRPHGKGLFGALSSVAKSVGRLAGEVSSVLVEARDALSSDGLSKSDVPSGQRMPAVQLTAVAPQPVIPASPAPAPVPLPVPTPLPPSAATDHDPVPTPTTVAPVVVTATPPPPKQDPAVAYAAVSEALTPADRALLAKLRDRGLLAVTDRQGWTLLDHLKRLTDSPLVTPDPAFEAAEQARYQEALDKVSAWEGSHTTPYSDTEKDELFALRQARSKSLIDGFRLSESAYRAEVLGTLLRHYDDPVAHVQQGPFGTCAPTTAQRHMVLEDPADYARLVADLFTDGKTTFGDRTYTLNRENLSHVAGDNPTVMANARDRVDMAVQSTLIDGETPGTYDKLLDRQARPDEVAKGVPQGSGLDQYGRQRLMHNLLAADFAFTDCESAAKAGKNESAIALLKTEMDAEREHFRQQQATIAAAGAPAVAEPVYVELRFNWASGGHKASHAVAAVDSTPTHLIISNPQGNLFEMYRRKSFPVVTDPESGKTYVDVTNDPLHPPNSRIYKDGLVAVPWESVATNLWGVYTRKPVPTPGATGSGT